MQFYIDASGPFPSRTFFTQNVFEDLMSTKHEMSWWYATDSTVWSVFETPLVEPARSRAWRSTDDWPQVQFSKNARASMKFMFVRKTISINTKSWTQRPTRSIYVYLLFLCDQRSMKLAKYLYIYIIMHSSCQGLVFWFSDVIVHFS